MIKACPFCGDADIWRFKSAQGHVFRCRWCGAEVHFADHVGYDKYMFVSEDEALKRWNSRGGLSIVRCKDCKYGEQTSGWFTPDGRLWCMRSDGDGDYMRFEVEPWRFCAWGEPEQPFAE